MMEQLIMYLENRGFARKMTNMSEISVLYNGTPSVVNAILIVDCMKSIYMTEDQLVYIRQKLVESFGGNIDVHIITIIVGDQIEQAKRLSANVRFSWFINTSEQKLIIYENQIPDFYGLKSVLEQFLIEYPQLTISAQKVVDNKKNKQKIPYVSLSLVFINVIVFLICTVTGDLLYNKGMMYGPYVLEKGEIYRLITAMFLHANVEHLLSNMLILYAVGEMMEKEFGSLKYTILYFLSGIGGGLVSMAYAYSGVHMISSIGASGAVFGLIGALLFLVIRNRGHFRSVSLTRIIFAIAYSIYAGVRAENIDNAAHVGGIITGFMIAVLLMLIKGKAGDKK